MPFERRMSVLHVNLARGETVEQRRCACGGCGQRSPCRILRSSTGYARRLRFYFPCRGVILSPLWLFPGARVGDETVTTVESGLWLAAGMINLTIPIIVVHVSSLPKGLELPVRHCCSDATKKCPIRQDRRWLSCRQQDDDIWYCLVAANHCHH